MSRDLLLLFVKSFELPLALFAAWILFGHVKRNVSWRGLQERMRMFSTGQRERDGPHDFAIAVLVLLIGVVVRITTATEALYFSRPQSLAANLAHALITAVGVLCLVRVIVPDRFRGYWIGALVVALLYAGVVTFSAGL